MRTLWLDDTGYYHWRIRNILNNLLIGTPFAWLLKLWRWWSSSRLPDMMIVKLKIIVMPLVMMMMMMMMMVETQNSIVHIALQCQSWYMGNKEFYLMTLSAILFARWWLSNWRRGDGLLVAARYDHRDWSHQSIPFLLLHLINIHHHSINIFYAEFWSCEPYPQIYQHQSWFS